MFHAVFVGLLVLSSSANAQSFPDATGDHAIAAKPARVSLTADGPWLPTPVAAKTWIPRDSQAGTSMLSPPGRVQQSAV